MDHYFCPLFISIYLLVWNDVLPDLLLFYQVFCRQVWHSSDYYGLIGLRFGDYYNSWLRFAFFLEKSIVDLISDYYYYYSSNLRAHGVCDYGTLPIMRQDLSSYLTTYIYKYTRPFRMVFFFCLITVKLSNCLLRSRDSEC